MSGQKAEALVVAHARGSDGDAAVRIGVEGGLSVHRKVLCSGLGEWAAGQGALAPGPLAPGVGRPAGLGVCLAVEVVDLLAGEREAVHLAALAVGVDVVLQPADHVDVAAPVEVLGRVLGLLAPERPLDRRDLVVLARAAPGVGDDDHRALADRAFAALDLVELDGGGETAVALFDANE